MIFVRIYSNLPEKFVSQDFFWKSHKRRSSCVLWRRKTSFRRISTVSLVQHTMRINVSKHLCPNFAGFFSIISEILPGFLTNQNFWGCACAPLHPPPPTPLSKLASRSSVETPSLLFVVLNTGTPTNSLKVSMQYSCQKIPKLANNAYTSNAKRLLQFTIFYAH